MNEATIAITIMSILILLIFVGMLIWGIKSGQFKNVEEAKYHLFRLEDEPKIVQKEQVSGADATEEAKHDVT
jgi:nitrogen fixation-related uncharacterized protein